VVGLSGSDPLAVAVAWLGIVAAGRCVAPVAADLPAGRRDRWRQEVAPVLELRAEDGPPGVPGHNVPSHLVPSHHGPSGSSSPGSGPAGVLLTSSGTTGPPKLVRLTVPQLLHTAASVVRAHELGPDDRCWCPLPLHHVNAEVVGLLATLLSGGTLVLDERFHRTGAWELLAERRITWFNAVPAVLALLLRGTPPARPLPHLRFVRSASAPLPRPVHDAFVALSGLPVVETYGMTEAGSQITANDLHRPVPGSVGRPVGVDLRIAAAGVDGVGRVQIRGAGVVTSYASAAGAEAFTADGWLDTGDLGWLDRSGALFLAGRDDDVINRGGEKVFPRRIEDVLHADPAVLAAAVVGLPHDVLGQVPVAALILAEGVDEAQVRARIDAACAEALSRPERPVALHVLSELPGGVNGKVSRRAVRELLL
jgi:acyl-CoA synthetase (AMP-forming)/AMP-acid ligase II